MIKRQLEVVAPNRPSGATLSVLKGPSPIIPVTTAAERPVETPAPSAGKE
ncbi:hypothetical protein [Inquilinus sp. CA228]